MTNMRQVGNLPPEPTSLVGRRTELSRIRRACERSGLVTLTGVGGVGKTRLALRAAADLQFGYPDGAWLVELSALDQAILLPHTIAEALPLADRTTRAMGEVLAEYLAERRLLLVLDTCEHLIDACARVVTAMLEAAPGLTVLATSRRPLGLPEEQVLVIDPLPVPAAGGDGPQDAVLLLAERTAAAVPGFAVTAGNRADVVRLCRRLEGLPLAIELAAARLRELSVAELCDRLEDRFAALGDSENEVAGADPPWHQALRTAIGWSHELCTPGERLLWARASVFSGSFDDEAVTQVCGDARLPAEDIPALLDGLVAKSILSWAPTGGGERYRMLDTIREYGALWLRDLGEQEHLRARHRDFYLALARRGDAAWFGPDQISWNDRTTAEHDNLRAALEYSLAHPADHLAVELAAALWFFWYPCGFLKEGQHYLERALRSDDTPSRVRNRALWVCSLTLVVQGDAAGGMAWATECDESAGRLGDGEAAVAARAMIMAAAVLRGDLALATALAEAMLAVYRPEEGLTLPALLAWLALSHVHTAGGRVEEALKALEDMSAECDRHGERWMRTYADLFRSMAELELGRFDAAEEHARSALGVKHRLHDSIGVALALDVLSCAAAANGRGEHAARLLGMGQQLWGEIGQAQLGIAAWVAARETSERQARAAIGEEAFLAAFRAGYRTSLDVGIVYALTPAPRP
ncbi:NB-ARC domain-containing protein [Actinomadura sp. ATCC 31491]|uniref:NB-ARC domain-containing protein n=1 Tax=Actinomadura luzonensis TaxID=2805427 RepID=A0ABT0G380_9ACTN|nr:NB-ARC domain-containing protein [Actinomadura luzonensis]MCK2219066.1 NB-ARC domain-containing protein [Actinomadura luzonensis]